MSVRVVEIDRVRDAVVLEFERDLFFRQFALDPLEVVRIGPESNVSHGQHIAAWRGQGSFSRDREERQRRRSRAHYGRMVAPDVLVPPLEAKHILIPASGSRDITDRQSDVIDSLNE